MKVNQKGFSVVVTLLIVVVIGIIAGVGWYVYQAEKSTNNTYNSAGNALTGAKPNTVSTKTSTKPATNSKTYSDAAKAYTASYPQDWTIKEEPDNGLSQLPVLDTTEARFTPTSLPSGASGNTWVGISSYKSSDMAAALDAKSATQSITINGYKALYYQAVVPATKGQNGAQGAIGYTDDYYAVTNNGVTLVFYFREKQDGNGTAGSFDASSIVPAYTAVVKSVKFTN